MEKQEENANYFIFQNNIYLQMLVLALPHTGHMTLDD